jgi:hypothetical protein
MQGEFLIPIFICLGLFAMIFGIVYMNKRENLAMIEKGLNPKEYANRPVPYRNLKWGLLLIGAGAGLLVAYIVDLSLLTHIDKYGMRQGDENPAIYFALIAIGGGLGLVGSYRVEKKELLDSKRD